MQLLSIDDEGFVSLLDDALGTKEDLKLPEGELGTQIRAEWEKNETGILVSLLNFNLKFSISNLISQLTVVAAMGEEQILAFKNKPSGKD